MKSKVLILMSGSIAAYKICQVISRLVQGGSEVQVVATPSALQFIGAATLEGLSGKKVLSDLFEHGEMMSHIHLMRWADVVLVAPATAHTINRMAQGLGDDLLTTLFLAHDFKKPFLVAPAMNTSMYLHPVTQKSIQALKGMGVQILETASGVLACGEVGWGRLLDPDLILKEIQTAAPAIQTDKTASRSQPALNVLITSGGTQEAIDQVRVIGNLSTGKTGAHLAQMYADLGADVTLLRAENAVAVGSVREKTYVSFGDFKEKFQSLLKSSSYDVVIHAAAISDYSVSGVETSDHQKIDSNQGKISSSHDQLILRLKRNPKIISHIREWSKNPKALVFGFKMTVNLPVADQKNAVSKLFSEAGVDYVVHNDLNEIDSKSEKHFFHLYKKNENSETSLGSTAQLGQSLTQISFEHWLQREAR